MTKRTRPYRRSVCATAAGVLALSASWLMAAEYAAAAPRANCGAAVLESFKTQAQNLETSATTEGERLVKFCPKESYEALQWTSFLFALGGQKDRARTIDRLWIKPPSRRAKPVERTLQLARAGTFVPLRDRIAAFDPAYAKDPRNRLTLARALARAGEFDAARKEYFTYLAKQPSDQVALIEYRYLNVWSGDGSTALREFRETAAASLSQNVITQMERGVLLVYHLWPELAPAAKQEVVPSPSPSVSPTPVPESAPVPAATVSANDKQVLVSSDADVKSNDTVVDVLVQRDQVDNLYQTTTIDGSFRSPLIDPFFYGQRTQMKALNEAASDSVGVGGKRQWLLHETLQVGAALGWFSSPAGGLWTGLGEVGVRAPHNIKVDAFMSREPLARSVPLIKDDHKVIRYTLGLGVRWRDVVSWQGDLRTEDRGVPHEHHELGIRTPVLGGCTTERCVEVFVPLTLERYQTLSPYYYNDEERQGVGLGAAAAFQLSVRWRLASKVQYTAWQALTTAGERESYATSLGSVATEWLYAEHKLGVGVDLRQTSSERSFRKWEVPTSFMMSWSMTGPRD